MNKFYNLPFKATEQDYQDVLDSIVNLAKLNQSVLAVYLMGGEWHPGISDLDIVVVYKDEKSPLPTPANLTEKSGKIFTHRYLAFHQNDFNNFSFFYPTVRLKLIYGNDLKPIDPKIQYDEKQYKLLLAFNLIDYLIHKMAILPSRYKTEININVRKRIAELKSLIYDFEIIDELGLSHQHQDFLNEVRMLRESWFSGVDASLKKLLILSKESQGVIFDLIRLIDEYLKENYKTGINWGAKKANFKNRSFKIRFLENYSENDFSKNKVGIKLPLIKGERVNLNLPISLAIVLTPFSTFGHTNFGKLISNSLGDFNSDQEGFDITNHYAQAKINLFDKSIKSNGFYRAPFLFGFSKFDLFHSKKSLLISRILSIFNQ